MAQIYYSIALMLHKIIFDSGRLTPFWYNLYRFFVFGFYRLIGDFYKHLVDSSILKGDEKMGKIFGINANQVYDFTPKGQDDVPADERLTFLCKFLDVNMSAEITDAVYTAKGFGNKREELLRAGTQEIAILRRGLVGWKNFFYSDGTEVEWEEVPVNASKQKISAAIDKNLNKIPPEQRGEIADYIRGSSTADQD